MRSVSLRKEHSMNMRIWIAVLLLLCITNVAAAQFTTREIYDGNKGAVVLLLAYDAQNMPSALGSGFYFEKNKIASNFHVVEGASRVVFRVIGSKEMHEVRRVASVSKALDLAILEVDQPQQPVKIAPLGKMGVGDKVVAIGNPRGLEGSVSEGIVSAIRGSGDVKILQITAPISPGSSGGPLFSIDGDVVGVTTATLRDSQSLNFAVPASLLLTLRGKGAEWEPVVGKDMPSPVRGSAGIDLVSPVFENIFGNFQFTLSNSNNRPITNLTYLLIFKLARGGNVVHFVSRKEKDIIPPGLAKRFKFRDKSLEGFMVAGQNTYPYTLGQSLRDLLSVELRVLTYDFIGDSTEPDIFDVLQK